MGKIIYGNIEGPVRDILDSNFKRTRDSNFKQGKILDSNFYFSNRLGFQIQIWTYRALIYDIRCCLAKLLDLVPMGDNQEH